MPNLEPVYMQSWNDSQAAKQEGTTAPQDYDVLIVSDLHLSEGCHPDTKKFSPNEDFLFDAEFARFLAYYSSRERWPDRRWNLVINGDFLDILQVTAYADAPPDLVPRERPDYGLPCGERETVYKLRKVVAGHPTFFETLAEFIVAGNVASILKGNHDVELHYPAVRTALLEELRSVYRNKLQEEEAPDIETRVEKINGDSVHFYDWFLYEPGLYYIEHGNQYDELNSFRYFLAPLLPEQPGIEPKRADDIDLPWGSLFVRYLFNRVEKAAPFADNIKPCTRFVWWFLRRHTIRALKFLFGDARYMIRKMRRAWKHVPDEKYTKCKQAHEKRLREMALESQLPENVLGDLDGMRAPTILKEFRGYCRRLLRAFVLVLLYPFLGLFFLTLLVVAGPLLGHGATIVLPCEIIDLVCQKAPLAHEATWLAQKLTWVAATSVGVLLLGLIAGLVCWLAGLRRSSDPYLDAAKKICTKLGVRYVFLGHTHEADLQSIGPNGEEYFNTGTWTKVFSEEERLIREESELVFAQVRRKGKGLVVKLLKWNDEAGRADLVRLFS